VAGSGAELVGGVLAAGVGMPVPSGQIPPPWAWWENEAPTARAACSSSQAGRLENADALPDHLELLPLLSPELLDPRVYLTTMVDHRLRGPLDRQTRPCGAKSLDVFVPGIQEPHQAGVAQAVLEVLDLRVGGSTAPMSSLRYLVAPVVLVWARISGAGS
jgi:hypothetical protein